MHRDKTFVLEDPYIYIYISNAYKFRSSLHLRVLLCVSSHI